MAQILKVTRSKCWSADIKVNSTFLTVHYVQISQLKFVKQESRSLCQNQGQLIPKLNLTYQTVHRAQISRV